MGRPPQPLPLMETLLLNRPDFGDYADLPESLDMDRLRPHILGAQRTRLRPLLLDALTNELLRLVEAERTAPQDSPAPLVFPWDILRTKAVAVVACAAMARYMPFAQQTSTATGYRIKDSQYSQPADGRDLARQAAIYDGDALSYEASLTDWLKVNGALLGSFYSPPSCCGTTAASRTPSVVVQGIRRPEDTRPAVRPRELPATPVIVTPPPPPPPPAGTRIFEPQFERQFE
jgi:hypothetical protein